MLANESAKCLSGRALVCVRVDGRVRGGKMPRTFGDDERVAAEDDRDVMVPAGEGSPFEVVEPQLALELGMGLLSSCWRRPS